MSSTTTTPIDFIDREMVELSFKLAEKENQKALRKGDPMATSEFIYPNQKADAANVVSRFYESRNNEQPVHAVSIKKNVKVGADGFMMAVAQMMCTHIDDDFVISPENVMFLTGMSNKSWQDELERKIPSIFKDNVFHHGQLQNAELANLKNALIFVDEIDTASKEDQKLHKLFIEAGLMNFETIRKNRIYLVFITATLARELVQLKGWGAAHTNYSLTTPPTYCGIEYYLEKQIIQESYDLSEPDNITKWIQEDIVSNYGDDFRVHLVRMPRGKGKSGIGKVFEQIANSFGVRFYQMTSKVDESLDSKEYTALFTEQRDSHIILGLKGKLRRATRIPDSYKLQIGAVHVSQTRNIDNNVLAQDLPGRMAGYIRAQLDAEHKIGPIRSDVKGLIEYVKEFNGEATTYQSWGYKTNEEGKVKKLKSTMVHPDNFNIENDMEVVGNKNAAYMTVPRVFSVESATIECIVSAKGNAKKAIIKALLALLDPAFYATVEKHAIHQITNPKVGSSYKRHITDLVNKANENKPGSIDIDPKERNTNFFNCYVDSKQNRLVIMVWNGAL